MIQAILYRPCRNASAKEPLYVLSPRKFVPGEIVRFDGRCYRANSTIAAAECQLSLFDYEPFLELDTFASTDSAGQLTWHY